MESLKWEKGWSASPIKYPEQIYYFDIFFGKGMIGLKHCFYEVFNFFVFIEANSRYLRSIRKYIYSFNSNKND